MNNKNVLPRRLTREFVEDFVRAFRSHDSWDAKDRLWAQLRSSIGFISILAQDQYWKIKIIFCFLHLLNKALKQAEREKSGNLQQLIEEKNKIQEELCRIVILEQCNIPHVWWTVPKEGEYTDCLELCFQEGKLMLTTHVPSKLWLSWPELKQKVFASKR